METTEQKELLRILVTRLYEECGIEVSPLYPKVLIRVLPKEQKKGEIWLPEGTKQNKPTWEGIVIKVYEPFFQKIYLSEADWVKDNPDPAVRYMQRVECALKPGDHVLFPHIEYGVVPVWPLDGGVGDYRMIPESIILGKLEYERETTKKWVTELLVSKLEDWESYRPEDGEDLAEELLKRADVIRKDGVSLTISGK